jgi:hypothetical protein
MGRGQGNNGSRRSGDACDTGEKVRDGTPGLGWLRRNEPVAVALMPSARKQVPDKSARVERSYRKMMMYGHRGGSLAIR